MKKIWVLMLLIMILVTIYVINNTYAKYYSEAEGKVEQIIGKWIVKINDTNIATGEEIQEFTINQLQYNESDNTIEGKIAPGMTGYFDIILDATESSVAVKYDVTIDGSALVEINKFIKISKQTVVIDGTEKDDEIVKTDENTYTGIVKLEDIKSKKTNTVRVYVEWENDETESNDEKDTSLGKIENTQIEIPVTVKISQYLGEKIIEYNQE